MSSPTISWAIGSMFKHEVHTQQTIQQWQHQHPTGSKLEMLEAVKEAASVNTQIWHDNFKQKQQQHRRDLWRAVKLAKERVQLSQYDGQLIANLLQQSSG